jgi:magnesium transporter
MANAFRAADLRVPRVRRRKVKKPAPGSPPGTLELPEGSAPALMHRFLFDENTIEEGPVAQEALEQGLAAVPGRTLWLDIQGLPRPELLERLGRVLGLSPLTLEDILHVNQRPKLEEFEGYLFVVIRQLRLLKSGEIENEQMSFVLRPGLLVTIQEFPGDDFEPVRKRLRDGRGVLRKSGADYLAYALMDAAIDSAFPVLEEFGEAMDAIEEAVWTRAGSETYAAIHRMRRELRQMRRAVWPMRDVAAALSRSDIGAISANSRAAFRDCHDHVLQVADFLETSHERTAELSDLNLSVVSERTNQVIKVLTIIGTIFMPLTFLCGVYGMNFDTAASPLNMPELTWRYGYLAFWIVSLLVVAGMLVFFRRKGWLGGRARSRRKKP